MSHAEFATRPQFVHAVDAPALELTIEREAGVECARKVSLDGDLFRIGSHPNNDLVVADPLVSRFHFRLERDKGVWRLVDTGSLNGTRLGGVAVRDADLPMPSCAVDLGESRVHIRELSSRATMPILARPSFGALYGKSLAMQKLFAVLERVARSEINVLVEGESGTGKELVAAEIVKRGPRAIKPFVVVDCSAVSPALIESTLFGHAKGSFTGAVRERIGAFEAADTGTVFLDEVGEMPLEMQPKLLRVLEAREVVRVGETEPRKVDVRVVAATNRSLEQEMNAGRFREDLYFRLSVIAVRVPPLRARLEDLDLLVPALLESMGALSSRDLFSPEVMTGLKSYSWPGNVRELRNYVERAVVLRDTAPSHGVPTGTSEPPPEDEMPVNIDVPFRIAKDKLIGRFEQRYVSDLLAWAEGNVSRAARKGEMDRMNLHRIIGRYGLRAAKSFKE